MRAEIIRNIFNAHANSLSWGFTNNLSRKTLRHLTEICVSDAIFSIRCYLDVPSVKGLPISDWLVGMSMGHFLITHCCVPPGPLVVVLFLGRQIGAVVLVRVSIAMTKAALIKKTFN